MQPRTPLLLPLLLFLLTASLPATDYHVAKTGDDANPGTAAAPFLTLGRAAALAGPGDVVFIHEGTYEETLRPARSGTATAPVVFRAAANERVIITAMQALPAAGWRVDRGGVFYQTVDWDLGQDNFVMHRATALDLARWPNNTDGDPFTLNSRRNDGGSPGSTERGAFLTDRDIPDIDWAGGSILFYGDRPGAGWTTWKAFITSSSRGRVNFDLVKNQAWIRTFHPPADRGDYFLEGVRGALDYDNEWFFDEGSRRLYVQLPGGAAPAEGAVRMRRRKLTVDLNGRSFVHLENVAVFGGGVEIEGRGNELRGVSSFYGSYTRGVTPNFHADSRAVFVKWNAENTVIERCEIGFGAGTGIWDSGRATRIENNYIHDFDFLGDYDAPLMIRGRDGARVLRNTVTRGGRDGIQIISKNSRVAYNDVSYSNLIADDCALIYTLGMGLNMEIDHNWFHHARSRGRLAKAAGIYLDNDAGDVSVHHNVVFDTEWSSVQINWDGTNLDIFNNTLWDGDVAMGAWHKPGTMFRNVRVWNNLTNRNSLEPQSDKRNNVIQESGNPFADTGALNFMLRAGTPAVDAGRQIAGITDGFAGAAPDAGAYERGRARWLAGVDWDITAGPAGRCYGLPGEDCTARPLGVAGGPASARPLRLFPNPTGRRLYLSDGRPGAAYRLLDATGRTLRHGIPAAALRAGLPVGELPPGLYLLADGRGGVGRFVRR